ncbi:MAG TPA: diguanylate cyclase [Tepidisphaeraceae bacterium]|jgi:two-component system cell cycle response regulator
MDQESELRDVEKLKLLIIEDDADQRELIRETLEDHFGRGTVVAVASKAQAVGQPLEKFDMILSDYNLPDSTGIEILQHIRSRCDTPVILVTGENVGHIAVEAIKKGATDYIVKLGDYLFTIPLVVEKNLTVAKVMRENDSLRHELERKNAELVASLQRERELAATDPLTGLYNRRHFSRVLDQLFAEAQRYNKDLACVMIDMDGFKKLNDTHGHQLGDQLLMLAGKVISANMRRMDVAARYGGDEFVLLLPHASDEEATLVAQRISEEFKHASAGLLSRTEGVTMSMGVGTLARHRPAGADQLVAKADAALYRAKAEGRARIVAAEPSPRSNAVQEADRPAASSALTAAPFH